MDVPPPPDPKALLRKGGLRPKKSWGQNFLQDASVLERIAEASGAGAQTPVVELGAGLGALTYYLCRAGGPVVAVERDRELAPLLRDALAWADALEVVEADAARFDWAAVCDRLGGPVHVAGNLPYQISSRIMVSLADAHPYIARAVLTVQKEVADRLCAAPGGRDYGLLTVLVGRAAACEQLFDVPPTAFMPPPKVESTVVAVVLDGRATAGDEALVAAARAAFSQRRKTLKNAVKGGLGADPSAVAAAIEAAGLDPGARAETVDIAGFGRLGRALADAGLVQPPVT